MRLSYETKATLALIGEWLGILVAGMFVLLFSGEPNVLFGSLMATGFIAGAFFAYWRHSFTVAIGRALRPEFSIDTPEKARAAATAVTAAMSTLVQAILEVKRRAGILTDGYVETLLTLDVTALERDRAQARADQVDAIEAVVRRKPVVARPRFAGAPMPARKPLWPDATEPARTEPDAVIHRFDPRDLDAPSDGAIPADRDEQQHDPPLRAAE